MNGHKFASDHVLAALSIYPSSRLGEVSCCCVPWLEDWSGFRTCIRQQSSKACHGPTLL